MNYKLWSRQSLALAGLLAMGGLQGATAATTTITSDASWRVSTTEVPNWQTTGFDDSAWATAAVPAPNTCGWTEYDLGGGILSPVMWSAGSDYGVYFRKQFTLSDVSVNAATLYTTSDDDHKVFVNGKKVVSEFDGTAGPAMTTNIKKYLTAGTNTIAAYAQDTAGGCQMLGLAVVIDQPSLGGTVSSATLKKAVCTNTTTGQSVTLSDVKGATAWDCLAAGLKASSGDVVTETLTVKVK
jgi:hypothetical protein